MKVGTDGVLLGAWATINHNPYSILDIGTGTGLIALQLAQKSNAEIIDAIEIDDLAYEQATSNFENSSWADRLFCYHASFLEFAQEIDDEYDLIVSNPPFFKEDVKSNNPQRDLARFQDALPFDHLLAGTSKLLSNNGKACFIIPFSEEDYFITIANQFNLKPNKITRIKGNKDSKTKRSLLELSFQSTTIQKDELVIEIERHQYTQEYINLVKDYYLKL